MRTDHRPPFLDHLGPPYTTNHAFRVGETVVQSPMSPYYDLEEQRLSPLSPNVHHSLLSRMSSPRSVQSPGVPLDVCRGHRHPSPNLYKDGWTRKRVRQTSLFPSKMRSPRLQCCVAMLVLAGSLATCETNCQMLFTAAVNIAARPSADKQRSIAYRIACHLQPLDHYLDHPAASQPFSDVLHMEETSHSTRQRA